MAAKKPKKALIAPEDVEHLDLRGKYASKWSIPLGEKINHLVECGASIGSSAALCGISTATLAEWLAKGRDQPDTHPEWAEFREGYYRARKSREAHYVAIIDAHTVTRMDGQLSMQALEKLKPKKWSARNERVIEMEVQARLKVLLEGIYIPPDQLQAVSPVLQLAAPPSPGVPVSQADTLDPIEEPSSPSWDDPENDDD